MSSSGEHCVTQVSPKEVGFGEGKGEGEWKKERGLFDYVRLVYGLQYVGSGLSNNDFVIGERQMTLQPLCPWGWMTSCQHLTLKAWRTLEACWSSVHTGIPKKLVLESAEERCSIRTGKLGSKSGASRQTAASIILGGNFLLQIISLPGVLQLEF